MWATRQPDAPALIETAFSSSIYEAAARTGPCGMFHCQLEISDHLPDLENLLLPSENSFSVRGFARINVYGGPRYDAAPSRELTAIL